MASVTRFVDVLILMAAGVFQVLLAVCPPGWLAWRDACYILLPDKMDWQRAKEVCDGLGSSLIVPDSQEEHDFIWPEMKARMQEFGANTTKDQELWIGCLDVDDNGTLSCPGIRGDPIFKHWADTDPNAPEHTCVRMIGRQDGKWADNSCLLVIYAACETRASHYRASCLQADADGRFGRQCLLNHEIKNLTAEGVIGCGQACWAEPPCYSFNLWQEGGGKKVCQLNNATSIEAEDSDLQFVKNCNLFDL